MPNLTKGLIVLPFLALAACSGSDPEVVNPAAEFCVEQGGTYDTRIDKLGGAVGICTLPSGEVVDAMEFYTANAPS